MSFEALDYKDKIIDDLQKDITDLEKHIEELNEFLPIAFCLISTKGVIIDCNHHFSLLTGYPSEDMLGKNIDMLLKNRGEFQYIVTHTNKHTSLSNFETMLINKKGTTVTVLVSTSGRYDYEDHLLGYFLAFNDITGLRRIETSLIESEKRYRSIFYGFPEGIMTVDNRGFVTSINDAGLKLFGAPREYLIGKHFTKLKIIDATEIPKYLGVFYQILKGRVTEPFVVRVNNFQTGEKRTAEVFTSLLYEDGKKTGIQAVSRDITDKVKADIKINQQNKDLRLLNKINSAIIQGKDRSFIVDLICHDTRDLFHSASATIYLLSGQKDHFIIQGICLSDQKEKSLEKRDGLTSENHPIPLTKDTIYAELVQKRHTMMINDKMTITRVVTDLTDDPSTKKILERFAKRKKITSVLFVPLLSTKELIGLISIARDHEFTEEELKRFEHIAEQVSIALVKLQMEEELHRMNSTLQKMNIKLEEKVKKRTQEIEDLLKHKDQFINQLGHDLKNPLNPLINLLPLLKEGEHDKEKKELFQVVLRNVDYMKNLVVKTIELAKLNSPTTKFFLEDVRLSDEITAIIETNRLLFDKKAVSIKNRVPFSMVAKVDRLRIMELFTNLFTNAVKYSEDSGTIVVNAEIEGTVAVVSIADDGIGMTEEQISHVFDEFYKVDPSRHDFESSGLGMPICKRIVEKHGGHIWVESPGLGKGTTIFFTLPLETEILDTNGMILHIKG